MSSEALPLNHSLSWELGHDAGKPSDEYGAAFGPVAAGWMAVKGIGKTVRRRRAAKKARQQASAPQGGERRPGNNEKKPGKASKIILGATGLALACVTLIAGMGRGAQGLMGGNMSVDRQEVETLSIEGMEDVCLQKERKQYNGVVTMKGRWLKTDLSGLGVNLNADKQVTVKDWQKDVIRCFPMGDILNYQYDPNNAYLRSGGATDKPTITVNVPLENMKTYVADAPDAPELPGTFTVRTEGLTGWALDLLAGQLKNKAVTDLLSPEIAQMVDVGTQMDEIIKSVARVQGARAIGEACINGLGQGSSTSSILENYLKQNIQKVIVNDFSVKKKDLPRLDEADVRVNLVNKFAYEKDATADVEKDKKNADALNKIVEGINSGGILKFEPPTAATTAPVECKFSSAVVEGAPSSTPTGKGER